MPSPLAPTASPPPPGAAPPAAALPPPSWLLNQAGRSVDATRNLVLAAVFALAFLLALAALVMVVNGRTIQPYVLQAGTDGAILPAGARLVPYRPGGPERRYFLAQWARHLLALDAHLSEGWLAEAYQLTRGKATVEFTDWLRSNAPLQHLREDPSVSRTVNILGISLVDDEVALLRVSCEERSLARPAASVRRFLLTIHSVSVPPASEEAILRNPIGLQITDFQLGEDLEK